QPQLDLIALQRRARTAHQIVDGGPADALPLRHFAVGPVFLPGQVQDAPLVRRQQRSVEVKQAEVVLPGAGSVKHLALTVYGRSQTPVSKLEPGAQLGTLRARLPRPLEDPAARAATNYPEGCLGRHGHWWWFSVSRSVRKVTAHPVERPLGCL